jgi:hypothetical protein
MAALASAAPTGPFECVGERPRTGGEGADEGVAEVEDLLVPVFGAGEVVGDVGGELLLLPVVPLVELVAEGHAIRVTPCSLGEIVRAVWRGLTADHRLAFSAGIPVGCLLMLVLGACLR